VEGYAPGAYPNNVTVTTIQGVNAIDVNMAFDLGHTQGTHHSYGFDGTHNGVTAAGVAALTCQPDNETKYYNFTARKL